MTATEQPLAERWDGARWTDMAVAGPAGAPASSLHAVTCPTATTCLAAGSAIDASGTQHTLIERWDGSAWSVLPAADPPGATTVSLNGLSCPSTTSCTAVGSSRSPAGVPAPLAESWDGHTWSLQPTPSPASTAGGRLTGVSCASPTACTAVGTTLDQRAFAEHWDGTSWALDAAAAPPGADLSALNAVVCPAPSTCIAAGSSASKKSGIFGPGPLAERWDGSGWTVVGAVNPPDAFHGSEFTSLSCLSTTACTAVGHASTTAGPQAALAEGWDGGAWTIQSTPATSSAGVANLAGVSCPVGGSCTAVGTVERNTAVPQTLAEQFDGRKWALSGTVDHDGAQVSSLIAVSCPSPDRCMAVGTANASRRATGDYPSFAGAQSGLSEWFDGTGWALVPVRNPPDGGGVELDGVACASPASCVAVGSYDVKGTQVTLAERWDGHSWVGQHAADPANLESASLRAVSCTAADSCTAVGTWTDWSGNDYTLAERWDGRAWAIQPTPNPPDSSAGTLTGVSCSSASACMAVGFYIGPDDNGTRLYAIAESWDGSSWTIQPVPDPVPSFGATSGDGFSDVSCTSPTACIAVGNYETFDRPDPVPTLAERWDGQRWTWQPTPNPANISDALENLSAISCTSATSCRAVGYYYGGTGTNSGIHTIGERWDGTSWALDPPAEPAGAQVARLNGVSCVATGCRAVGNFSYEDGSISRDAWPTFTLTEASAAH
ncbi:MAG TPA: hypothetical protein VL337_13595 [Acidimicrobiales bacterium]|nr:hypothetical protein [Acidimicrobiales bacterium]